VRLLHRQHWYEPRHPLGMYELQYEELIQNKGEELFPNYICSPFKKLVTSPLGDSQADLLLVEKDYRRSYVVEVELSAHSLYDHVLPQVERLVSARYGDPEAEWIAERDDRIDVDRLRLLFSTAAPEVLVIVNSSVDWRPALSAQGILLAVAGLYSDRNDDLIISLDGDEPEISSPLLSVVVRGTGWLNSMLRVESPATLAAVDGDSLEVLFRGLLSRMRVRHIAGAIYLKCDGDVSEALQDGSMDLVRRSDGWLELVDQSRRSARG